MLSGRIESLRQGEKQISDPLPRPQSSDGPTSQSYKMSGFYMPNRDSSMDQKKQDDGSAGNRYSHLNQVSSKPPIPFNASSTVQPLSRGLYENSNNNNSNTNNSRSPDRYQKRSITPTPESQHKERNMQPLGQNSQSQQRLAYKPLYQNQQQPASIHNENDMKASIEIDQQFKSRYQNYSNLSYGIGNQQRSSANKTDLGGSFKHSDQLSNTENDQPRSRLTTDISANRYESAMPSQYLSKNYDNSATMNDQQFNSGAGSENIESYIQSRFS